MTTYKNFASDIFSIRCQQAPRYADWAFGKPADYTDEKYEFRIYHRLDALGAPLGRGRRQYRLRQQ